MRHVLLILTVLGMTACSDRAGPDEDNAGDVLPSQARLSKAVPEQPEAKATATATPESASRAGKNGALSRQLRPGSSASGARSPSVDREAATATARTTADRMESAAGTATLPRPTLYTSGDPSRSIPLGRLPEGVTPLGYVLDLEVDPGQEVFSGRVEITVSVDQPLTAMFLHGEDLEVKSVAARLASGERIAAQYAQVHKDGVAQLTFDSALERGEHVLEFEYSAAFGRLLHGLYKVTEGEHDYAFTQMESVYARQAFPSFDEPAFKTPFELTLTVNEAHVAIANTPVVDTQRLDNGKKRIRFAKSLPMTTYLFAIAVGPLDVVDAGTLPPNDVRSEPLPFRGVAAAGKGEQLRYALRETGAILEALERYFDQPYPYEKLDIIAVPDFDAGAMENIGAITFREKLLLLEDDAPPQQKRAFASVMAHELAHMWFGNLVTMPWWDDIWLNESFATWMSYKAVEAYDPSHKPFISQRRRTAYAMKQDRLTSARQIREPVEDNDDIVAAFDGITYSKGGAVLSMFEQFLGEHEFREGIREHMRRFEHGSATVHDLIDSLSKVSGQDLAPSADTFLFQNGVPLVEASLDCERNRLELAQSRFLPVGSGGDPDRTWIIPVCVKLGYAEVGEGEQGGAEAREHCLLMNGQEESLELAGECPDWVLPNDGFSGYYHWFMPPEQTRQLLSAADQLSEVELLSIADSVRAGFASGRLEVEDTWLMIKELASSEYPSVAGSLVDTVRFMQNYLTDNAGQRWNLRRRAGSLFAKMEAHRAFDASFLKSLESNEMRIHYSNVASFMAEVAYDSDTRQAALAKARVFLDNENETDTVSRSTLDTLLTVAVQDGGQGLVNQLWDRFHDSDNAWFRDLALSALARSRDAEFGEQLRALGLANRLRSNEIRRLYLSHAQEDVNVLPTWMWLQEHLDELVTHMPARHVGSLAGIGVRLCEARYAQELDARLRPVLSAVPGGERKLNNALEELALCASAREHHGAAATAFFSATAGEQ